VEEVLPVAVLALVSFFSILYPSLQQPQVATGHCHALDKALSVCLCAGETSSSSGGPRAQTPQAAQWKRPARRPTSAYPIRVATAPNG